MSARVTMSKNDSEKCVEKFLQYLYQKEENGPSGYNEMNDERIANIYGLNQEISAVNKFILCACNEFIISEQW